MREILDQVQKYQEMKIRSEWKTIVRNIVDDSNRKPKKNLRPNNIKKIPQALPGMGLDDDMFQAYDMHPGDMNFEIVQMQTQTFDTMLEMIASFSPDNAPGKEMKLIVKEPLWTFLTIS